MIPEDKLTVSFGKCDVQLYEALSFLLQPVYAAGTGRHTDDTVLLRDTGEQGKYGAAKCFAAGEALFTVGRIDQHKQPFLIGIAKIGKGIGILFFCKETDAREVAKRRASGAHGEKPADLPQQG